jgi:hypothetical protein
MSANESQEQEPKKYWTATYDESTRITRVAVQAEVFFEVSKDGAMLREPRLLVAGGGLAVHNLVTIDQIYVAVEEAYDTLPNSAIREETIPKPAAPFQARPAQVA